MKRSPSAYNFLTKDKELRESIKRDHPEWVQTHMLTEYSRLWKTYTVEEKQKYVDQAAEAKAVFQPSESITPNDPATETEITMVPKRGRSSWMCYLHHPDIRKAAKESNPEVKVTELTKIISIQWKALDTEGQQPYIDLANEEKQALLENPQMVAKKTKKKKMTMTETETTTNLLVQPTTNVIDVSTLQQIKQEIKQLRAMVKMLTEKVASRDKPSVNNEPSYEDGYFSGDSSS